ncbi:helix-turn-helix domain-containing protein [Sphingomonas sp. DT-204]|uniref:helix-turn-helix domain-containing protein n=1 Tax=Sphingomonas sp. DT-204 TaxID=3396166 RepID=UPI003F1B3A50
MNIGVGKGPYMAQECTMIDRDDVRYFLAVARSGSVRAAAARLGVNHSTTSPRSSSRMA